MKQHLAQDIKQNIQRSTGKRVEALVCMTVYEDGDVSTHATDNIQQCTDGIFAVNAKESLRTSVLQTESDRGLRGMFPPPLLPTTADLYPQQATSFHSEL
jgi:ABC-type branched-subunit amino acid transport system substrate-binding protein